MSFFKQAKKYGVIVAVGSAAFSSSAFAEGGLTDTIKAALAAGQTNYGLVTAGVISMAALGFGVAMIVGWLRK